MADFSCVGAPGGVRVVCIFFNLLSSNKNYGIFLAVLFEKKKVRLSGLKNEMVGYRPFGWLTPGVHAYKLLVLL